MHLSVQRASTIAAPASEKQQQSSPAESGRFNRKSNAKADAKADAKAAKASGDGASSSGKAGRKGGRGAGGSSAGGGSGGSSGGGIGSGVKMDNVFMTFKNQAVLRGVSWEVKKGERVGLVGMSHISVAMFMYMLIISSQEDHMT